MQPCRRGSRALVGQMLPNRMSTALRARNRPHSNRGVCMTLPTNLQTLRARSSGQPALAIAGVPPVSTLARRARTRGRQFDRGRTEFFFRSRVTRVGLADNKGVRGVEHRSRANTPTKGAARMKCLVRAFLFVVCLAAGLGRSAAQADCCCGRASSPGDQAHCCRCQCPCGCHGPRVPSPFPRPIDPCPTPTRPFPRPFPERPPFPPWPKELPPHGVGAGQHPSPSTR